MTNWFSSVRDLLFPRQLVSPIDSYDEMIREKETWTRENNTGSAFLDKPVEYLWEDGEHDWMEYVELDRKSGCLPNLASAQEMQIYGWLKSYGVEFYYERFLESCYGQWRRPDFTLIVDGYIWYWEHWGMINDPGYRTSVAARKHWYERNHLGHRLLETWGGKNLRGQVFRELEKAHFFICQDFKNGRSSLPPVPMKGRTT